ncbi:PSD1 and planctomycete cytochrome C domain-containing protein [Planctomycetaceae bacterium]|jgi:hypothetical protein|nr:PSD1 and planctomycete cytochrome C domain-containing protein [Planctomycetaceae bacterium]
MPIAAQEIDFNRDIRPILSDKCVFCHGPDKEKRQAVLRLDTQAGSLADLGGYAAIKPGDPDASALVKRILSTDEFEQMPPPDSKRSLSKEEKQLLIEWIKQGAIYQQHWSLVKPERPQLPKIDDQGWPENSIDHFILKKLTEREMLPSAHAERETLIRRVTLDLTGLPPTLEEVDTFLKDDSPNAYERVVDRLLKSPRYGEHMAATWLDVARYSDSNGYQQERTRTMWPWRDWVIRAFNENMPFDQFTIDQLAGDLLENPTRDQFVATGFNRNHMLNGEGGRIAEESRVNYVIDRVNTTSTTWLGLTMACCQCHDHKYDPITQVEFYQFYDYFNHIDETGRVDAGGNANPVLDLPTEPQLHREQELKQKVADLQSQRKNLFAAAKILAWEDRLRESIAADETPQVWQPLTPEQFRSQNKQTHEFKPDGSIFLSGKNPAKDVYEIQYPLAEGHLTGLRIDALHHDSFTNGGLARSDSGNFVLTDVSFKLTSSDGSEVSPKITSAKADFEQGSLTIEKAYDGNPNTGWAVNNPGKMKNDRSAMFLFESPVAVADKTTFKVSLKFESPHAFHQMNWFRLSASSITKPTLDGKNEIPAEVLAAFKMPPADRTAELKKALNEYYAKNANEVVALDQQIEKTKTSLTNHVKSYLETMVMKELEKPRETYRLQRGAWDNPDKSVRLAGGIPSVLPAMPENATPNRLALARWLVSRDNPLTARVTINRFWQQFFGAGLVKTVEDFGTQGESPSHPELLDWLAVEMMESGWDLKHMVKLIVMSATYQQSSKVTPKQLEFDPYNRFLGRGPRYRLSSLALRDQALFLSGLLHEQEGGKPVKPYQPEGVWLDMTLGKIKYEQDHGDDLYRRSIYIFWRRSVGPTMLFDSTARQVCTVKQSRTNTPLHALTMMNETAYLEAARNMAARVIKEGGDNDLARLGYAFRLATSRQPTEKEQEALVQALNQVRKKMEQDEKAVEQLLAIGESPVGENIDRTELAAYAAMMNLILNLDEVLTRE